MKRGLFIIVLLLTLTQTLYAQVADDWVKKAEEKINNQNHEVAMADYSYS